MILRKLATITIIPTATMMVLANILLETLAAIGEAIALQLQPNTASQCLPLTW